MYRASEHGFSGKIFGEKCNKQGSTVCLFKVKGKINTFGAFAHKSWKFDDICVIHDKNSFLFSINCETDIIEYYKNRFKGQIPSNVCLK